MLIPNLIRCQHNVYHHTLYDKLLAYHYTMMYVNVRKLFIKIHCINVNIPCFLVRWQHAIYQHTLNGKISTYHMFIHQNLMSTYHKWSTHQVYLDISIPFIKISCMIRCEHIIIHCMSTYHVFSKMSAYHLSTYLKW